MSSGKDSPVFSEILPKQGMLFSEETVQLVLCKPKILPLKSVTLEKLERMQKEAQELLKLQESAALDADQIQGSGSTLGDREDFQS